MKEKMVCFFFAATLLMSLLTACREEPVEITEPLLESSAPTDPTKATRPVRPTETTAPTEETEPTEPPYVPLPPEESRPIQPTEDPIGLGINPEDKPNVENGVYASCGNYYYTLYLDSNEESVQFYLVTEKPLPEDSRIRSDLASVTQVELKKLNMNSISFDNWMIADWLGANIDWAAYWQLEETYYNALFDWDAGKCDYDTLLAANNARSAYYKRIEEYLPKVEQFKKDWLAGEHFFHIYEVTICLSYKQDEDLTELELMAGDRSRTIPVGLIRLRQKMDPSTIEINNLTMRSCILPRSLKSMAGTTLVEPRSSGCLEMKWAFVAQRDMTLTDAYFFANGGEGCKIVGAEVQLTLTDGKQKALGQPRVILWTPGIPLEVKKNEQVECWVCYEDPQTQMMDYGARHYMVLEYTCEGITGKMLSCSERDVRKWSRWFDWYFWAFSDYDFMAITEEYYRKYSQYMEEHNDQPWPVPPAFPMH